MYSVTVVANDGTYTAMLNVTVTVTNVDERGTVSLSGGAPEVGVELTASLDDPDGNVSGEAWQWARDDGEGGDFEDIAGATSAAYTPVADDEGKLLRATVTYTDGEGAGKTAEAATSASGGRRRRRGRIRRGHTNGTIDRSEVIAAIDDFFDGVITRAEVIEVDRPLLRRLGFKGSILA